MSPVKIIDLNEREARLFMRDDLFDGSGRSLILAETRNLSALDLHEAIEGVLIRAKGLIGYLPLTSKIVLNIHPKFPIGNLWYMLKQADEEFDRILPILRTYNREGSSAPHQMLARGFCHYLREILKVGIFRSYYQESYVGYFRPKVEFGRTLARYHSRGDLINVEADLFTFSGRLPINELLKSACLEFLRVIPNSSTWQEERRLIEDALNALHSVSARKMRHGGEWIASSLPAWLRDHYLGALRVYSVYLGHTPIGFSYEAFGSEMPSFLFRLDDIFESFVRNTLRDGLLARGLSVVNGNKPSYQYPLFRDSKIYPIKPDAIVRRGRQVVAIGEVKYKPKIEEADRYQVISHVVATNSPIGIWVSPSLDAGSEGLTYVGAIGSGARFYHYRMNISSNLESACAAMVASVADLVAS